MVRARLSDALLFLEDRPGRPAGPRHPEGLGGKIRPRPDRSRSTSAWPGSINLGVTFHAKLGTQGERVERIARLAEDLGPGRRRRPDAGAPRRRCWPRPICTTEVVGEFPELQALMGRKYALLQGENPSVAAAIEEHYKPQGPSDRVPTDPVSVAVALADKLDTLSGFWAIDEKPTGSKDPMRCGEAALGVIRIVLENELNFSIDPPNDVQVLRHQIGASPSAPEKLSAILSEAAKGGMFGERARALIADAKADAPEWLPLVDQARPVNQRRLARVSSGSPQGPFARQRRASRHD